MNMNRIRAPAVAALMAMTIVAGFAGSASVADAAAQKADLHKVGPFPANQCAISATGAVEGFVVVNETERAEALIVEVSLKGGAPNKTYSVALVQCRGTTFVARNVLGTLTTNGEGHGNLHGTAVERAAATSALVTLAPVTGQRFASAKVTI